MWLLAWADCIEELKTVCWCGEGATCNARIDAVGNIAKTGEQVNQVHCIFCAMDFIFCKKFLFLRKNSIFNMV